MLRRQFAPYAISLLPFLLAACGDKASSDPRTQAPLVRVGVVQGAGDGARSFTGVVAARVQSDLGFRVSGKVLERLVDAGQMVMRGQPLMRIDPVDLGLQAYAQREAVEAARARFKQAAGDEVRYRGLIAANAISASAYDQIKAAADTAKAQLRAAEAQASVANNASGYAVLLADADGVVVETLVEPGQVVSAGQVVVRLARAGQREAIIQLPETMHPVLGSAGQAKLYGQNKEAVQTQLRQISRAADRLTRTFEARYVLSGDLANAPLGATVTIRLPENNAATNNDLLVPISALYDTGRGPGVWLISEKQGRVTWRAVKVRSLGDEVARVEGPLRAGDQVVSLGAHLLHEGESVRVMANKTALGSSSGNGEL